MLEESLEGEWVVGWRCEGTCFALRPLVRYLRSMILRILERWHHLPRELGVGMRELVELKVRICILGCV